MTSHLSCSNISNSISGTGKVLSTVLNTRPPLPFHFFKRWSLHDFHTSRWTCTNPSAQIKRTRLGRSCIDKPTIEMISVSRYGGYELRESLVTAFRIYRSVDQSEAARTAGQAAVRSIRFDNFMFDAEDEQEVAVDFACLYLNACVLFNVLPSREMITQLLSRLSTLLHSSFHWECVLSALIVCLQPSAEAAVGTATAFVSMLRGALPGTIPVSLSHDGKILLLFTISKALALLIHSNTNMEDQLQQLLDVQLKTIELLCATPTTPLSREERFVLVDAVCWRYTAGGCSSTNIEWVKSILPLLQVKKQEELDVFNLPQCTRLFCALCVLLTMQHTTVNEQSQRQQWEILDPIVRHLDERVRIHSISDILFVLTGLQTNHVARSRYKKLPSALLDHLREQQQQQQQGEGEKRNDSCGVSLIKDETGLEAMQKILLLLSSTGEDELAEAAETVLTDVFSSTLNN
ncbi:uncharacterized protein TM35_000081950 [Trypanosoma theileri]|uniref:Uncharacterized protein n=1 Tax=Trypanosoma theileri TaxID=67003 RepID=A0A1X0P0D6_9TRYP|nr:uncharacterized protein TM35_000081950 [Trypanosoma theileri]ORC90397.1 hypothetical protein TM35_000081950 [Trypanosoma theileri]